MSVEAFSPPDSQSDREAKSHAIELASEAIVKLRALIAEIEQRLGLERTAESVDSAMVEELEEQLRQLTNKLEETFAFLEEFDPILHQKLKDNS